MSINVHLRSFGVLSVACIALVILPSIGEAAPGHTSHMARAPSPLSAARLSAATGTPAAADTPVATEVVTGTPTSTPTDTPTPTPTPSPTPTPTPTPPPPSNPNAKSCIAEFPVIGPICVDWFGALQGLLSGAWQIVANAFKSVVTGVLDFVTQLPNYADRSGKWIYLNGPFDFFMQLAWALFLLLATLRVFAAVSRNALYSPYGVWRDTWRPLFFTGFGLASLRPLLGGAFTTVNAFVHAIDVPTADSIGNSLTHFIVGGNPVLAGVMLVFSAIMAVVAGILFFLIGCTKIGGEMFLALFYMIAPVCVVMYLSPVATRLFDVWFRTYLSYLMWSPFYAVMIQLDAIFLFELTTEAGFTGAIAGLMLGIVCVFTLGFVPALCNMIFGGIDIRNTGAMVIQGAGRRIVGRIPVAGRLANVFG